jgi:2-polyprenyl-3-methyl-5-hydroxy-6-metoxy-1,4-benzoquinol methylase
MVRDLPARTVLDIGCADGGFLSLFPAQCRKYGIDIAENCHRPPDIHFWRVDVDRSPLPFESSFFDLVYAGEIIEHVHDTVSLLREIQRVLRPGGTLLLTTPNLCSIKNLYYWLKGQQLAWVDYKDGQHGHVRYFSPASLAEVLMESGFYIERMCSSGVELGAHIRILRHFTPLVQWVFSHNTRGSCLIVRAAAPPATTFPR